MATISWKEDDGSTAYVYMPNPLGTQSVTGDKISFTVPAIQLKVADPGNYMDWPNYIGLGRSQWGDDYNGLFLRYGSTNVKQLRAQTSSKIKKNTYGSAPWRSGTVSLNTATYFNKNNPTTKSINFTIVAVTDTAVHVWPTNSSLYNSGTKTLATIPVQLNVPPIFSNGPIEYDTNFDAPYAGLTTASVDISNLTAYYDGYITRAVLKVGNQESEPLVGDDTNILSEGTLSILLESVGTFTPTITVTDSRGQTKTVTLETITVKGYSAPQVIINSLERTDGSGAVNDEGECAVVTATFTWTSVMTNLTAPTLVAENLDGTTVTVIPTWYTDRALQNEISDSDWSAVSNMPVYCFITDNQTPDPKPFDTQDSYNITIMPNDEENPGTPVTATLGSAFYTMDFLAGGHGIAFGMPSSQEGFFCNMDAHFKDGANLMRALHDFMRPVGSTYPTVDPNFDPNVTWGGTWEKLPEGYILLSGSDNGSYVVGDDTGTASGYKEYGENTHTLTPSETAVRQHHHNIDANGVDAYMLTVPRSGDSVSRRTIKNGTGSELTNNYYGASAITRRAATGETTEANGSPHNIMQKSIAVYWWIRTA